MARSDGFIATALSGEHRLSTDRQSWYDVLRVGLLTLPQAWPNESLAGLADGSPREPLEFPVPNADSATVSMFYALFPFVIFFAWLALQSKNPNSDRDWAFRPLKISRTKHLLLILAPLILVIAVSWFAASIAIRRTTAPIVAPPALPPPIIRR